MTKIKKAFQENQINTIDIMYNNSHVVEDIIVCGTRGWYSADKPIACNSTDNQKIVDREVVRLRLALKSAQSNQINTGLPIIVFLHFPPVWNDFVCTEIVDLLKEFGIKKCFFGHIHGSYNHPRSFVYDGIEMILTSADFLNFAAIPVFPDFI